jgi:gamma-glutamyltranspeptidase/glutathione hydrolase
MRGAIAAGSRHTVDAGVWALREGGTATDAAVAAALAAFVAEGPLTGPAGGGFLLLRGGDGETVAIDCFFAVPTGARGAMDEVVIDFGDASTQLFHVGDASVAVPGLLQGLFHAHGRMGRLPWRDLVTPALALARAGIAVGPEQAFLHEILVPILQREEGGRYLYGTPGRVTTDVLVPTLGLIRDAGPEAVFELFPELGSDLEQYVVTEREPLATTFAGATVLTTPTPSRGGAIVRAGLDRLEVDGIRGAAGSVDEALDLVAALAEGYATAPADAASGAKPTGTTHVSVIDSDRAVVSLSSTLGSGSGVFRHGFQLNNMLGELDVIGTDPRAPRTRLPSMMTPTIALADDSPRLVVGSAGSVRLAGAIMQVTASVVGRGLPVREAIDRPRLHVDGMVVHVEGGWDERVAGALVEAGWDVVPWAATNLFFGGTSAVELLAGQRAGAAGDPRRGGHGDLI